MITMGAGKNYLFSVLDITRKRVLFYSWFNNTLTLEQIGSFSSAMYTEVFTHLIAKLELSNPTRIPVEILVGFGPAECQKFSEIAKPITFRYDVRLVHDECFTQAKAEIEQQQGAVRYISLQNKSGSAWKQFLSKSYVQKLSLPKFWEKQCHSILNEFKNLFTEGIDHLTFIGRNEANIITSIFDALSAELIANVKAYPTQHGVITLQRGNGIESDFVYSLVQCKSETTFCCFRFQDQVHGVSIASFDSLGTMTLHSPSGTNDIMNTIKLIGLMHPAQSGCRLFKAVAGKDLTIEDAELSDLIRIARHQVLVRDETQE